MELRTLIKKALDTIGSQRVYDECPACSEQGMDSAIEEFERLGELEGMTELGPCTACILRLVLEEHPEVPRIIRDTVYGPTTVYMLQDSVLELGEGGGYAASREGVDELLKVLIDEGVIDDELAQNIRRLLGMPTGS